MLIAFLAAAALAGADTPEAAAPAAPAEAAAPAAKANVGKPLPTAAQICIRERETGSHRMTTVCYDKEAYRETQDRLRALHKGGGGVGGGGAGVAR